MQNKENDQPQDLNVEQLEIINGIKFTPREIDIIACIISGRPSKKIASFLSIKPKTVDNNIRNIMIKLECNTRDLIIDFIEKFNKSPAIRKHYSNLIIHAEFKKALKEISRLNQGEHPHCLIAHWPSPESNKSLIQGLEAYLKLAGVKVSVETIRWRSIYEFIQKSQKEVCTICVLSRTSLGETKADSELKPQLLEKAEQFQSNILFLLPESENHREISKILSNPNYIDLNEQKDYYLLVFEIIKRLFPSILLEKVFLEFKEKYKGIQDLSQSTFFQDYFEEKRLEKEKSSFPTQIIWNAIKRKKRPLLLSSFIIGSLGIGFLAITGDKKGQIVSNQKQNQLQARSQEKEEINSIRSDLHIPAESFLLHRPDILKQIDDKLKGTKGIQTVALVGIGGAGKTTLAHQFAHSQTLPIVWEINAETKESFTRSFESLAENLAKTEQDQKILRGLQEIKDLAKREEKIIQFVQEHLKCYRNWLLIYDNVEHFADVQKSFPNDINTWGQGKIIITSRDTNIQNNRYINYIMHIGQLDPHQKLLLFTKLIGNENSYLINTAQMENTKKFLSHIPSFPLDISITALYIKSTNTPYNKYLDKLKKYNVNFEIMQKNILKESGDYIRTRYNIISLPLKHLIEQHKDFKDLLLLISLLDSQDIPRPLLEFYKKAEVVDSFIYNLKKYSLITSQPSSNFQLTSTLSLHRSTQSISLNYLIKTLNLERNSLLLKSSTSALEEYIKKIIKEEDLSLMKLLLSHCEKFLSHEDLLTSEIGRSIESKLGAMHYYLGNYARAKTLLEESLANFKCSDENPTEFAWTLGYLGNVYRDLGDYEKAKILTEQSYKIFKKHLPESHPTLAWISVYLGIMERYQGNYERARGLFEKSLNIYEHLAPKNEIGAAWALGQLGIIDRELGNYEDARNTLEKSLSIFKKHRSDDHIDIAWAYEHLGVVYKELGNLEEAKVALQKSLAIYKKFCAEDDIYIAWDLAHLGDLNIKFGNYKEARSLLEKSLSIYEKNYKKDHLECARVLRYIGQADLLENDIDNAENFFRTALKVFQRNKSFEQYKVLENLSELYIKKFINAEKSGDRKQSEKLIKQATEQLIHALKIVYTHFPKTSPHITRIQAKIKELRELQFDQKTNRKYPISCL